MMDVTVSSAEHDRLGDAAKRWLGISLGFGNQLLFLVTVWYLFWFLRNGSLTVEHGNWILIDCALAVLFAVAHSAMLFPPCRKQLSKWIPRAFYDSVFCLVTCVSLMAIFLFWRTSETVVWEATGAVAGFLRLAFYGSWLALFYSLWLTGLGYQNGWTPFYYWLLQKKEPRREFKPRGAYRLIRHPVYMSFLGLLWFSPQMTLDHMTLTAIWTGYIFYGSYLKDRRLEHFIGEPYRNYSRNVPGYPLMPYGPLAKQSDAPT
jgi:methanethiol S-methyltransferase